MKPFFPSPRQISTNSPKYQSRPNLSPTPKLQMNLNFLKRPQNRGLVYAVIAASGILYEIFLSKERRFILIAAYSIVILVGLFYYLKSIE